MILKIVWEGFQTLKGRKDTLYPVCHDIRKILHFLVLGQDSSLAVVPLVSAIEAEKLNLL